MKEIQVRVWNNKTKTMTSEEVLNILAKEYPTPDMAFIREFRGGTGWSVESRADAIAMHLWPSKGLELIGYEVKVSRSDWLRELKQPEKATPIKKFCDRWYLIVPDSEIVKDGELPMGWGLKVIDNESVKTVVEAEQLYPRPVDRPFIASLMRRATFKEANESRT
jgi:hypothetical protein